MASHSSLHLCHPGSLRSSARRSLPGARAATGPAIGVAARILGTLAAAALVLSAAVPAGAPGHGTVAQGADTLTVSLAAPQGGSVAEGATGHFAVSVAGSTAGGAVTVRYSVSGTAASGTDYTALSGEVTVAQGDSGAAIDTASASATIAISSSA